MKLIVGLGNPGNEYLSTRHNIGFMLLDRYFDSFILNDKMNAMELNTFINNEKIIIVKPLSYMNLSGDVVLKYANYYKVNYSDILIIHDDLDMPVGKFRVLFNRGHGGHNGVKDIINKLNSKSFYQLKIGISNSDSISTKDYVLGKFSKSEMNLINLCIDYLKDIFNDFVNLSHEKFIQKYNTRVDD